MTSIAQVVIRNLGTVHRSWSAINSSLTANTGSYSLTGIDALLTYSGSAASSYPLAANHYESRVYNMGAVYPRPDSETNANKAFLPHRTWPAGVPWKCPVIVDGGAWPFLGSILDGPSGLTLGTDLVFDGTRWIVPTNYMVLSWSNPTSTGMPVGGWPISIGIKDQEYNRGGNPSSQLTMNWTLNILPLNDATFVYVSGKASGGSGTYASPYAMTSSLWGGTQGDTTNKGKMMIVRDIDGTISLAGATWFSAGGVTALNNNKMISWIGIPGESPVIDCNNSQIAFQVVNSMSDCCFRDFTLQNSPASPDTFQGGTGGFMFANGAFDRGVFAGLTFINQRAGTNSLSAHDNNACIRFSAADRNYIGCSRLDASVRADSVITVYHWNHGICEYSKAHNINNSSGSTPAAMFLFKDTITSCTMRANEAWNTLQLGGSASAAAVFGQSTNNIIDVSWNAFGSGESGKQSFVAGGEGGSLANLYLYRNALRGDIFDNGPTTFTGPLIAKNNVYVTNLSPPFQQAPHWNITAQTDNYTTVNAPLDSSLNLQGTYASRRGLASKEVL